MTARLLEDCLVKLPFLYRVMLYNVETTSGSGRALYCRIELRQSSSFPRKLNDLDGEF